MSKLSAVVSAYNEEKNIERCLRSLEFADEIIVVDNESSDKTTQIAGKYTNNVYFQKNDPQKIDIQKNFGFEKASKEWILSLDGDEEVSPELAEEIKSLIKTPNGASGYWIPRKNYMFGKWINENTGWYPDYQLRLFKKGKGRYESKHVHEDLKLEGRTKKLSGHIIHHNYESIAQFVNKIMIYAPNEAKEYIKNGYKFSYYDAIRFPVDDFLKWFFSRKGYKDGFHGLMLSFLMAFYHFLVFAFIWEKKGFVERNGENFLSEVEDEFKRSAQDINYWIRKEKLEKIRNPLKKNIAKIREKIRI